MAGKIRERLTYANVMVTVLAFIVLGGTAWALAKNSVGSKQLKANAVHTADIDNGAVTFDKLAADSVTTDRVKDGTLQPGDFAAGVLAGDPVVRSTTEKVPLTCTESSAVPGSYILFCNGQQMVTASCNAGEHATGGGAKGSSNTQGSASSAATAGESYPEPQTGTPAAWTVKATGFGTNSGGSPGLSHPPDPEVTVYAVCAT